MKYSDDDVVDLRGGNYGKDDDEPEFRINHREKREEKEVADLEPFEFHPLEDSDYSSGPSEKPEKFGTGDKIKIKFGRFINLLANKDYDELFARYQNEDITISADLLTEIATPPEEKKSNKVPLFFFVGIVLGVALTWMILKL